MRFDAVVFDLDGTLTESGQGISRSAAYAIEKMGFAPLTESQLLEFVGPPLYDSFIRLCGMTGEQSAVACDCTVKNLTITGYRDLGGIADRMELLARRQGNHRHIVRLQPFAKPQEVALRAFRDGKAPVVFA